MAELVLRRGFAGVALLDVSVEALHATACELQTAFPAAVVLADVCDVTDLAALGRSFAAAAAAVGPLTLVCNNAGIATPLLDRIPLAVALNVRVPRGCTWGDWDRASAHSVVRTVSTATPSPPPAIPLRPPCCAGDGRV